jgi:hypothetical protein
MWQLYKEETCTISSSGSFYPLPAPSLGHSASASLSQKEGTPPDVAHTNQYPEAHEIERVESGSGGETLRFPTHKITKDKVKLHLQSLIEKKGIF